jgi:hypothetical protein
MPQYTEVVYQPCHYHIPACHRTRVAPPKSGTTGRRLVKGMTLMALVHVLYERAANEA